MPSWAEIQEYARNTYKLSRDEDTQIALIFAYEDGRSQQVFVRRFEAWDQECIEFRTPVCREEDMNPKVALTRNAKLDLGALALDDGMYFLIHNVCLRNLALDEFERPLHYLAVIADELEEQYAGGDAY